MSIVAILTDTHYGARKGAQYLHDHFEKFYSEVFFPTLKERGVKTILYYYILEMLLIVGSLLNTTPYSGPRE